MVAKDKKSSYLFEKSLKRENIMRNETVEEFIARGGKISKSTKVLGEKKTVSVNYKGSSCRLGKNGSGKTSRCEIRGINPLSSGQYGTPWIHKQ